MYIDPTPTETEKRLYLTNRRGAWLLGSFISIALLTVGGVLFSTVVLPWMIVSAAMTFYLLLGLVVGVGSKPFDQAAHYTMTGDYQRTTQWLDYPSIDIFLPTCGEDISVLRQTYLSVAKLRIRYPAPHRIQVWVLDDSDRQEVSVAAHAAGFNYMVRPDRPALKKAGNLRHAFKWTSGEYIAIFDADFCPCDDFFHDLLPYMSDPKVAIVQSPQYFRVSYLNNWVANGAAYVQELFYRLIQVNRDHYGAAICVGTNALYRRRALEPFGGTAPIGHSEDVHTGFQCLSAGWKVKYVPVNLAAGLCPDSLPGFFIQQYRWATGSLTLLFSRHFWRTQLSLMQRLSYLSGQTYYIATGLGVLLTPLPGLILLLWRPEAIVWYNIAFSLPSLLFSTVFQARWSRAPWGFYALRSRVVSYWAHLFALADKMLGQTVEWTPTGAPRGDKAKQRYRLYGWLNSIWTLAVATSVALGVGYYYVVGHPWYNFAPMMALTAFSTWLNLSALYVRKT